MSKEKIRHDMKYKHYRTCEGLLTSISYSMKQAAKLVHKMTWSLGYERRAFKTKTFQKALYHAFTLEGRNVWSLLL